MSRKKGRVNREKQEGHEEKNAQQDAPQHIWFGRVW